MMENLQSFTRSVCLIAVALAANAATLPVDSGVGRIVGVPARTMSFPGVYQINSGAFEICGVRDGLQVSRIDASLHAALVIEFEPSGDRAYHQFVTGAVSVFHASLSGTRRPKFSVFAFGGRAKPEPATGKRLGRNEIHESINRGHVLYFTALEEALYTSLKAQLFAAAQLNAGLVYYLGGSSPQVLRWFDEQLPQAAGTGFPSVVVKQISNPQMYATAGRLPTSWARMEFTIFGTGADSVNADQMAQALYAFLDTFNGDGVTGRSQSPNYIISDRDAGIAITQPMTYQRIIEARIFWNPNV
jgi:hypothetical protein